MSPGQAEKADFCGILSRKKTKVAETCQQAQRKPEYLVHRDKVRQSAQTIALKIGDLTYRFAAEKQKSKENTIKLHKNVP